MREKFELSSTPQKFSLDPDSKSIDKNSKEAIEAKSKYNILIRSNDLSKYHERLGWIMPNNQLMIEVVGEAILAFCDELVCTSSSFRKALTTLSDQNNGKILNALVKSEIRSRSQKDQTIDIMGLIPRFAKVYRTQSKNALSEAEIDQLQDPEFINKVKIVASIVCDTEDEYSKLVGKYNPQRKDTKPSNQFENGKKYSKEELKNYIKDFLEKVLNKQFSDEEFVVFKEFVESVGLLRGKRQVWNVASVVQINSEISSKESTLYYTRDTGLFKDISYLLNEYISGNSTLVDAFKIFAYFLYSVDVGLGPRTPEGSRINSRSGPYSALYLYLPLCLLHGEVKVIATNHFRENHNIKEFSPVNTERFFTQLKQELQDKNLLEEFERQLHKIFIQQDIDIPIDNKKRQYLPETSHDNEILKIDLELPTELANFNFNTQNPRGVTSSNYYLHNTGWSWFFQAGNGPVNPEFQKLQNTGLKNLLNIRFNIKTLLNQNFRSLLEKQFSKVGSDVKYVATVRQQGNDTGYIAVYYRKINRVIDSSRVAHMDVGFICKKEEYPQALQLLSQVSEVAEKWHTTADENLAKPIQDVLKRSFLNA